MCDRSGGPTNVGCRRSAAATANRGLIAHGLPSNPATHTGSLGVRGQAALRGRLYLQANCVSCAAMICQLSFRFNQVSVQIRH
jgi:hypothetical protein